ALRQFVSKYAGRHWEEFYEALFGYDAKLQARVLWGRGERGRERPRHAAWRDPIIRAIENRIAHRRENRERQLLARVEAQALRAKGIREDIARKQARANARKLVSRASQLRSTPVGRDAPTAPPGVPTKPPENLPPPAQISVQIDPNIALESAIAQILTG